MAQRGDSRGARDYRGRPAADSRRGADRQRPEARGPRAAEDDYAPAIEEGEVPAPPRRDRGSEASRAPDHERSRDGRGTGREAQDNRARRTPPVPAHNPVFAHAVAVARQKMAAMDRQGQQEQQQEEPQQHDRGAQALTVEPRLAGGKRKHEPIHWPGEKDPKQQAVDAGAEGNGASRPARRPAGPSPPLTLLEKAQQDVEAFQRHLEATGAGLGDVAMAPSPSNSEQDSMLANEGQPPVAAEAGAAQGGSPGVRNGEGGGADDAAAGPRSRWHDLEEAEAAAAPAAGPARRLGSGPSSADRGALPGDGSGGDAGAAAAAVPRSRWHVEEEEEEAAADAGPGAGRRGGRRPDGEGVSAAGVDEDLEELNRRERAELAAGPSDSDATPAPTYDADGYANGATPQRLDGLGLYGAGPLMLAQDMLRECRSVDEYEKLNRISEGTYGVVFRAREKKTGRIYALKKIKLDKDVHGFPQTSIREINVLLSIHHPNIVNVTEVVVGSGYNNVFMVMEYVDADLRSLLDNEIKKQPLSTAQVKCLMRQLLEGMAYLHDNWVLHRDLKTSNLLYSNNGQLKICDFGLARQYGSPLKAYTPMVVTLWYRAIERLMGEEKYSTALDMWSVGCIMAELLLGTPLFQGKGEIDQMNKIFNILGTPTQEEWPGWDKICKLTFTPAPSTLRQRFPKMSLAGGPVLSDAGFDLLSGLLALNPRKRLSAQDALKHPWFSEAPLPTRRELMPAYPRGTTGLPP